MKKFGPIVIIVAGVVLFGLIMASPVKPSPEAAQEQPSQASVADSLVEAALQELQDGSAPPMQAIMKIRKVAEEYPENTKANFTLGVLSMRTGQYENALSRLSKVIDVDPSNASAFRLMGRAHLNLADTAAARENFKKAMELATADEKAGIKKELEKISK